MGCWRDQAHQIDVSAVGLVCPNRVMCDTMYNKALAMGCIDEGPVGPRGADHGDNTGL